ncbi:cobyrinate a,c-diamide synthase [Altericista sp. CCNU0014]|uniref:cobyrinate a,c-diamide synthase n=1 Tax=Altericista sp. CCNU0014 TaxID=3082949 RepID=UPI00384EBF0F
MTIVIAGERSGVGKTTVTLALLAALRQRGQSVQSFKVGPDYIDPMFHAYITGRPCRNLDPVLTSEAYVRDCFARHSQNAECVLIEGVMGLFDGASGRDDTASTAHVARLLDVPAILILNCSSTSRSVAAIAHGYRTFDPRVRVVGVVLNRVGSDRHLELLSQALEPLDLPILGVLRRQAEIALPDRHLGLIPAVEQKNLDAVIERLADLGQTCFDWEKLLPLLDSHALAPSPPQTKMEEKRVRLAIAQDRAFSFYYADNLDLFQSLGAELVPWSPLSDRALPEHIQGLYFGGGFPEVFAGQLADNKSARQAVRAAIQSGMPTYAECGGLMYLCDRIVDFEQNAYEMTGIFPTAAVMGKQLALGYRQATMLQDSCLARKGDRFWGHEFHRSTLDREPDRPLIALQGYESGQQFAPEGWQKYRVHAAYTHLHFGAQPYLAQRFLESCIANKRHLPLPTR